MINPLERPRRAQIIYDGDCPFCANYVSLLNLREACGEVQLINARVVPKLVDYFKLKGMDLNRGMIFRHENKVYFGAEAAHAIARLSRPTSGGDQSRAWQRGAHNLLNKLLRYPRLASALYPLMRWIRQITLQVLGVRPIGSSLHD